MRNSFLYNSLLTQDLELCLYSKLLEKRCTIIHFGFLTKIQQYIYISEKVEGNPMLCKHENIKNQSAERMNLFMIEYYARVKRVGFFSNHYQVNV